jgi:hypothetical protein
VSELEHLLLSLVLGLRLFYSLADARGQFPPSSVRIQVLRQADFLEDRQLTRFKDISQDLGGKLDARLLGRKVVP